MSSIQWIRPALKELAELWLGANSRNRRRITDAVVEFERQARESPASIGEGRSGNRRIAIFDSLVIEFDYSSQDYSVVVYRVRPLSKAR